MKHVCIAEFEDFINELNNDQSVAEFILETSGQLIVCNDYAVSLFGYTNRSDMELLHVKDLVPDDFAELFPDEITIEHLTKGEFLPRVNKRMDGEVFASYVRTQFITLQNKKYVHTSVIDRSDSFDIKHLMLEQNVEVLKCELEKEKNVNFVQQLADIPQQRQNFLLCQKLNQLHPGLSIKDLELASLISFNLDTRSIAVVQNISINSVYVARKRLRKKMNVSPTVNLKAYFLQLLD